MYTKFLSSYLRTGVKGCSKIRCVLAKSHLILDKICCLYGKFAFYLRHVLCKKHLIFPQSFLKWRCFSVSHLSLAMTCDHSCQCLPEKYFKSQGTSDVQYHMLTFEWEISYLTKLDENLTTATQHYQLLGSTFLYILGNSNC